MTALTSNEASQGVLIDTLEMNTDAPHIEEDTAGHVPSSGDVRPRRANVPPRRYEPESGLWV